MIALTCASSLEAMDCGRYRNAGDWGRCYGGSVCGDGAGALCQKRLKRALCRLGMGSRTQAPQDDERGCDIRKADAHEADRDEAFLPGLSLVARRGDGGERSGPKDGSERGYKPVGVRR